MTMTTIHCRITGDRKAGNVRIATDVGNLDFSIDFDDVDMATAAILASKLLRIIADHWNDKAYQKFVPPAQPDSDDDAAIDQHYKNALNLQKQLAIAYDDLEIGE